MQCERGWGDALHVRWCILTSSPMGLKIAVESFQSQDELDEKRAFGLDLDNVHFMAREQKIILRGTFISPQSRLLRSRKDLNNRRTLYGLPQYICTYGYFTR